MLSVIIQGPKVSAHPFLQDVSQGGRVKLRIRRLLLQRRFKIRYGHRQRARFLGIGGMVFDHSRNVAKMLKLTSLDRIAFDGVLPYLASCRF